MAGSRRGPRYGQAKNGPVDIDPDSPSRRIGNHLRELRIQAGMKLKDVADAMNAAGFPRWSKDTVTAAQTGKRGSIRPEELPAIADLFGITVDQFLADALGETPALRQANVARRLSPKPIRWVPNLPPFQPYEDQPEELDSIAKEIGISRSQLCREAFDFVIRAYRDR
jgi:transcriptional regulator with XRE-family HTH domain